MKKSIIVGITIFGCVIVLAIVISILVTKQSMLNENGMLVNIYNKYQTDIDGAVQELMSSEEYNKMSKEKQIDTMGDLLNLYEQNFVIKNIHYDKSEQMYSFTYNYGDIKGALGGVMLKTWNPMMN